MNEDIFANNNSQDTAFDLDIITEDYLEQNLLLADGSQDWFKFSVDPLNTESLVISLEFANNLGDLDLRAIASNGNDLFSTGSDDLESVSLFTFTPGDYFIQVYGDANPDYSLSIDVTLREFEETITLDVDTARDQNDGSRDNGLSLRDAILIANEDPDNEYIINLQPGETYSLTKEGINEDFSLTGDLDIRGNITIQTAGENAEPATIDAGNLIQRDRVFDVRSYFRNFPELRIDDNYILEGQDIVSAYLTLDNLVITGGRTEEDVNDSPSGGGIFASKQSFLTILSSTITNNGILLGTVQRAGSALLSSEITTIINSEFTNNYSEQKPINTSVYGTPTPAATIDHNGERLIVTDSEISSNNSTGIEVTRDFQNPDAVVEAEIINSIISDNQGEGINAVATETIIRDSTISNNSLSGISTFSGTRIINSTISYNGSADAFNFRGNRSPGILINSENNSIENSTIANNFGSGISSSNFDFSVDSSTIADNQNGGIEIDIGLVSTTATTISNSLIANNQVTDESAGGLFVGDYDNNPQVNLENTVIANNENVDVSGPVQGNNSNLIGTIEESSGSLGTGSDLVNPNLNVRLAPLGDYGEATETYALYGIDISGEELDISRFAETISLRSSDEPDTDDNNQTGDETMDRGNQFSTPFYRFRNTQLGNNSTYIYVGEAEKNNILNDPNFSRTFELEGRASGQDIPAFIARETPGSDVVAINRYRNTNTSTGTYLFSTEEDFQQDPHIDRDNFIDEGIAFYAYPPNSGSGSNFTRFENSGLSDTFVFQGAVEAANTRQNFPGFVDQGETWAVETL